MERQLSDAVLLSMWDEASATSQDCADAVLRAAWPETESGHWAEVPLGQRDRAILAVRAGTIGPSIELVLSCPHCGELLAMTFDVGELTSDNDVAESVTVSCHETVITARPLRESDLAAASACPTVAAARSLLLARCITAAHRGGQTIGADQLGEDELIALGEALERADPGADLAFEIECARCAAVVDASLGVARFVWTELSRRARNLLTEVDVIARRYGWSEDQILNLTGSRRRRYLELAS